MTPSCCHERKYNRVPNVNGPLIVYAVHVSVHHVKWVCIHSFIPLKWNKCEMVKEKFPSQSNIYLLPQQIISVDIAWRKKKEIDFFFHIWSWKENNIDRQMMINWQNVFQCGSPTCKNIECGLSITSFMEVIMFPHSSIGQGYTVSIQSFIGKLLRLHWQVVLLI